MRTKTPVQLGDLYYALAVAQVHAGVVNGETVYDYRIYRKELTVREIRLGRAFIDTDSDMLYGPGITALNNGFSYILAKPGTAPSAASLRDCIYAEMPQSCPGDVLLGHSSVAGIQARAYKDSRELAKYAQRLREAVLSTYKHVRSVEIGPDVVAPA